MRWNILVMLTHLWEPSQRKVLLKGWIVPEVLEVECLLSGSELLGWLAGLRLGLKVRVELLLLGLPLLLGLVVPEAKQGVSELWRIEERVDAIDERLEERSWKKKHKSLLILFHSLFMKNIKWRLEASLASRRLTGFQIFVWPSSKFQTSNKQNILNLILGF